MDKTLNYCKTLNSIEMISNVYVTVFTLHIRPCSKCFRYVSLLQAIKNKMTNKHPTDYRMIKNLIIFMDITMLREKNKAGCEVIWVQEDHN